MKPPRLEVLEGPDELAVRVADEIRSLAVAADHPLTVALSGGSTPRRLYQAMAHEPFDRTLPWDRLELFFGDERAVSPDHSDSNFRMVREALLAHVPVRAHRMPADEGDAEAYARLLGERIARRQDGFPVFDIVLLGIGDDGHTASLFPGTDALGERERWVVMNDVPQLGTRRMTLTYPVLNAAARVWVLASGAGKRDILGQVLAAWDETGADRRWPILGVRPTRGELVWWLDEDASPERRLSS